MAVASPVPVPQEVLKAAHYALYRALVFARNCARQSGSAEMVYELMDALHEVPQILNGWGTSDNDVAKLRTYFRYFQHERWKEHSPNFTPPDLITIFEEALIES
jgi:hypothetical protein